MKKIKIKKRKKGFTLIELLAIIVILAIIMVVTIPTVLGSLADARRKTFQNSVNTVADWIEKQYALSLYDRTNTNSDYIDWCYNSQKTNGCVGDESDFVHLFWPAPAVIGMMKSAGVDMKNYYRGIFWINQETKRACVKLYVSKTYTPESVFKDITSETDDLGNVINGVFYEGTDEIYMKSPGCP